MEQFILSLVLFVLIAGILLITFGPAYLVYWAWSDAEEQIQGYQPRSKNKAGIQPPKKP
jgi:hypothetical protein